MSRVNLLDDLADFFSNRDNPMNIAELMQFWRSLSDDELHYYRTVALV